jgi:lysophospholipase
MTPEQLQELRLSLSPLHGPAAPAPLLADFLRFYRIDFAGRPGVTHRVGTVLSGPFSLAVHTWLQEGASHNLFLIHGYFDHTGLFGRLVEYGLSRGCNVVIFDLPGHGLSTGEAVVIDDFADYSRAIADVLQAVDLPALPLWVMAQSTGCAALVDFARRHAWPFHRGVLLAPLVRPVSWMKVSIAHRLLYRFADHVPREFSDNSSDRDFLEFVQRDPLQSRKVSVRWVGALKRWLADLLHTDLGVGPVLVIQGGLDQTVDWKYNLDIIDKLFPDSRVEYLPGAGHQLANESDSLRQRYYRVIDEYLGLRPATGHREAGQPAAGPDAD